MKKVLIPTLLLLLTACDDKAIVTVYQKQITQTPITCLKLQLSPEDKSLKKALMGHYPFSEACDLTLEVSYKSGIQCNSRFNAAAKSRGNFPNSYLKMEIRQGMRLQYSYYVDLTEKPDEKDIKKGWERIEKDLKIVKKVH